MKTTAIVLLATMLCSPPCRAQERADGIELTAQRDLAEGAFKGKATISIAPSRVMLGTVFEIDMRFDSHIVPTVFNPFFDPLTNQPAVLGIFDSDKAYIGDLLLKEFGSHRSPALHDWTRIGANGYVGRTLEVTAGLVPGTVYSREGHLLPPGKYFLQMVYRHSFISSPPTFPSTSKIDPDRLAKWYRDGAKLDLFRSNIAVIEFANP